MTFSSRERYALVDAALVVASGIELVRGIRPLIVAICALAFLAAGNGAVYLSGARARAVRRMREREYWEGRG